MYSLYIYILKMWVMANFKFLYWLATFLKIWLLFLWAGKSQLQQTPGLQLTRVADNVILLVSTFITVFSWAICIFFSVNYPFAFVLLLISRSSLHIKVISLVCCKLQHFILLTYSPCVSAQSILFCHKKVVIIGLLKCSEFVFHLWQFLNFK